MTTMTITTATPHLAHHRGAFLATFSTALFVLSASSVLPVHAQSPVAASVAQTNKTELIARVKDDNPQVIWRRKLVSAINFNLSAPAWKLMLSSDGVTAAGKLASNIGEYAREAKIADLDRAEAAGGATRAKNQPAVDALLKKVNTKVGVTIEATQPSLSPAEGALLVRYINRVGQILADEEFKPKTSSVQMTLVFSPSADDVAVSANADGSAITITAPTTEPDGWDDKMRKGLQRFAKEE